MSKFQLRCSCILCTREITVQSLSQHLNTHKPDIVRICPGCNKSHSKPGKFCSRTCANKRTITDEIKNKIKISLLKHNEYRHKIKRYYNKSTRVCKLCGSIEQSRGRFQSIYCKYCSKSTVYRESCKFTFNLKKYAKEFDISLLEKYGMFNPKTNPKGVSRDHILSVHYGKLNRIDPSIISHPANCKLITQSANSKKHINCDITLEELIIKIQEWDNKYR